MADRKKVNLPAAPLPSRGFDLVATLACLYLAVLTVMFVLMRMAPIVPAGTPRDSDRTLFFAANIATLTGFPTGFVAVADFSFAGKCAVAGLAIVASLIGIIGTAQLLAMLVGEPTRRIRLLTGLAVITSATILAMPFVGWFDAISAATQLGLSTRTHGPASVLLILVPLMLVAMLAPLTPRKLGIPSAGVIALTLIAGFAVLAIAGGSLNALSQSVNARATGFALEPIGETTGATQWTLTLLMSLGGTTAAATGGLGTIPLVLFFRGLVNQLRGRPTDRLFGAAIVWILLFAAIVSSTHVALLTLQPQLPADRALFLSVSAVSNVGLSHDPVSFTSPSAYHALSLAMCAGRLLPLMMLAWMVYLRSVPSNGNKPEMMS
jgi:Cation transport protein